MQLKSKAIFVFAVLIVTCACGKKDKDDEKGSSIGAPKIEPPVTRNLPTSMKFWSNSALNQEVNARDSARSTILGYMKSSGGAVTPTARLLAIDSRMLEIDTRTLGSSPRKCLATAASAYALPGVIPNGTFPMKFQCRDDLGGGTTSQLAFGLDDTDMYLFERTNGPSKVAVMAKAPKAGTGVEVWQLSLDSNGVGPSWTHIRANDADGGIEIATAGEVIAFAPAAVCGLQIKTKGDLIYAVGKFASGTGTAIACGEAMTFCINAGGTEQPDTSSCVAAGLNTFALPAIAPETVGVEMANTKLFIETLISGVEDFNLGLD